MEIILYLCNELENSLQGGKGHPMQLGLNSLIPLKIVTKL
jgi:hypothetical protein